jgi:hypothetical protein
MFIRIIQDKGMNESTYECDRCRIRPVKETFDSVNVELLRIEDTADGIHGISILDADFECHDLEIFFMNNDGKTFDRRVYKREVSQHN